MVGLINAYLIDPKESYQLRYTELFQAYFQNLFGVENTRLYNIAIGAWPKAEDACQVWIISGSSKSAYDSDSWIKELISFVQRIAKKKDNKIIGICFGHQLIAHALGGKTEKYSGGWGLGVQEFSILEQQRWMTPPLTTCQLLFSHQDQVSILPPGSLHLASSSHCKNQMYTIGDRILGIQGHPEFTADFAIARMDSRKANIPLPTFTQAMSSIHQPTDANTIGSWIQNFLKDRND